MNYRVEVFWKDRAPEGRARNLLTEIVGLGITGVEEMRVSDLYFLRGELSKNDMERLCQELLVDSAVQGYRCEVLDGESRTEPVPLSPGTWAIEVGLHPGVTDNVAGHLLRGAKVLGLAGLQDAATAARHELGGTLDEAKAQRIAEELLCNDVIQFYALGRIAPAFAPTAAASDEVEVIPLRQADDETLARMSVERVLYLSLAEMQAIGEYFRAQGRDPTDVELETLAQTWSEHCVHKTFKAVIDYEYQGGIPRLLPNGSEAESPPYRERIDGLLKTYIQAATEALNRPWVRSAFVDNAGILVFDDEFDISFKVETHNHPSALEPFGGANTGVGGVVRDIIGVSARPIANTDILCFGSLDLPSDHVPPGMLHPRRVATGVVAGIEDYGNKMGIPTVNGAILYDPGYTANPLVFCGCVGLAPRGSHRRAPRPGDLVIALGGRTGRDGLHGATFSSAALAPETGHTVGSVVQIGDPITEKALLEAVMVARDEGLYTAITDCGAGGFSSAVGEMGRETGAEVDLSVVSLKYPGLRPWEIWLSEAQERMVLAVPPEKLSRLQEICASLDVDLTVIGRFTDDQRLTVRYDDRIVGELEMDFLHHGLPRRHLTAVWPPPEPSLPQVAGGGSSAPGNSNKLAFSAVNRLNLREAEQLQPTSDLTPTLLQLLALPDIASKEDVVRRYDHEVQGGTVVKPFVGREDDGPSDAAVLRPLGTRGWRGVAIGCGINPHYGKLDPYAMAWAVVDEALRNVVAVGADPDRVALLDNFCWGDPSLPDRLGGLVRAAQGCHDAALCYRAPFVSGKDSLNNEYMDDEGAQASIPPTLLISALGFVPDVRRVVSMDLKAPGNRLCMLGVTRAEPGGSAWYRLLNVQGGAVPAPVAASIETMRTLHRAMRAGLVRACHDCSEGGLAVAAAEMAFAGGLGFRLSLADLLRTPEVTGDDLALFSETSGRFLVEVPVEDAAAFEELMDGIPWACLGEVTERNELRITGLQGKEVITAQVEALKAAWQQRS